MGKPDQLAKRILQEETPVVTGRRVAFEVPPEVPVGALQPDGVMRVVNAPGLTELDAPWSRLRVEVTLDVKMPRDHADRVALARCELRRHARWVQLLEGLRAAERNAPPGPIIVHAPPDPRDYGTWVVAPILSKWLRDDAERGVYVLEQVAPGCWRVGPGLYETLWIAANELPLRIELVPFLVARSGRALVEFLLWAAQFKGLDWTLEVVEDLGMTPEIASDILQAPVDDEEQRRIKTAFTRRLLEAYPEAANEVREQGIEQGIEKTISHQFERKLSRALDAGERDLLVRRIHTLGAARVGDVVLDLTPAELAAWLCDLGAK